MTDDAPAFSMRMLDQTGDTALTWSDPDDVDVLTFIQKKMDEGYVFFMERPRAVRAFIKHKKVSDVAEIKERKLIVADEDVNNLHLKGKITLTAIRPKNEKIDTVKKAANASEVAGGRSVATRPLRGG